MKKSTVFFAVAALCASVAVSGCSAAKKTQQSQASNSTNPFQGGAQAPPCFAPDDPEYFTATGIAQGPATQKGRLQQTALTNAQSMIAQKMQHAYEGEVKDYFENIGNNKGNDVEGQTAGDVNQILMGIINDTNASCLMFSNVDEKGNCECYVGIKVNKKQTTDAIADNLAKSEKAEIRDRAEDFRKKMAEDLKSYKGE